MRRALFHRVCLYTALGILALGCGDDDPIKPRQDQVPVPRYHAPTAPESTLLNYALTWELRDSVMVDSVIDVSYQGTSVDMADPGPATLTFFKSDEVRAVAGLAQDPFVSSVEVNLHPNAWSLTSFPGDPAEWVTVHVPQVSIVIYRPNGNDLVSNHSSMEFKLKPVTPASSSPTDTAWTIVRWSEVHSTPAP